VPLDSTVAPSIPITKNMVVKPVAASPEKVSLVGPFNISLQQNLYSAVWDTSEKLFTPNATCHGSNCIWESFDTIGFCSYCEDRTSDVTPNGCVMSFDYSDWDNFARKYEKSHNMTDIFNTTQYPDTNHDILFPIEHNCSLSFDALGLENFVHNEKLLMNVGAPRSGDDFRPHSLQYPLEIIWPLENDTFFVHQYQRWDSNASYDSVPCSKYRGIAKELSPASFMRLGYLKVDARDLTKVSLMSSTSPPDPRITASLNIKEAQVCSLNPCVKQLSVSNSNGAVTFQKHKETYGYFTPNATENYCFFDASIPEADEI
jgi:hypothetical protein